MIELKAYDFNSVDELELDFGGSDWLRITEDEIKIRLVGDFVIVNSYFLKDIKRSFRLPTSTDTPEALKDASKSFRVYFNVVDRNDNDNLKKLEVPYSVYMEIKGLQNDSDWAYKGLPDFDIKIKKEGKGLKTRYTVTPSPNKEALNKSVRDEIAKLDSMAVTMKEMMERDREKFQEEFGTDLYAPVRDAVEDMKDTSDDLDITDVPF